MSTVSDFLQRISRRAGLKRQYYIENNLPTDIRNILVIPFFGDLKAMITLSCFLLGKFKEVNHDKYIILCSWPGYQGIFPYIDEYWTIDDESVINNIATEAINFYNNSAIVSEVTKSLIEGVEVMTARDLSKYFDVSFTDDYWKDFKEVNVFLPEIPSESLILEDFKRQLNLRDGKKVIVYPSRKMRSRQLGKTVNLPISKDFWKALIDRLISEGYVPICYQNNFTYDMSKDYADRCLYLVSRDIRDILAAFRYIGCVIDVHTDVSKLAIMARCPFISSIERSIYMSGKEYLYDDFCGQGLPRKYIFSFSTQMMAGGPDDWKISLFDNIFVELQQLFTVVNRSELPSPMSSYEKKSYSDVRRFNQVKKIRATLINRK